MATVFAFVCLVAAVVASASAAPIDPDANRDFCGIVLNKGYTCSEVRVRAPAALKPHIIDRVLDGIETRTVGKHPAGENAPDLAVERDFLDFHERRRLLSFRVVAAVADARCDLKRTELDGFADSRSRLADI